MTARYAIARGVAELAPMLRAVVSEDQRIDRRDVRVQQVDAGLVALTCPQCGAAVKAESGQTVTCAYCRTVAFIPPRARPRGPSRIVKPIDFYASFEGPSPERAALEAPKPPDPVARIGAKAKGLFARGLTPLAGIELAPKREGLDVKQLAVTTSLTALALGAGYLVYAITSDVLH